MSVSPRGRPERASRASSLSRRSPPPRGDVGADADCLLAGPPRAKEASTSMAASSLRNDSNAFKPGSDLRASLTRGASSSLESPERTPSESGLEPYETETTDPSSDSNSRVFLRAWPSPLTPSPPTSRAARAAATRAEARAALFARRASPCRIIPSDCVLAAACSAAARVGSSQCRATPGSPYTGPTVSSTTASVSSCLAQARAVAARERTRSSGRLEVYRRGGRNVVVARAENGRRLGRRAASPRPSIASFRARAASPCVVQCCPKATASPAPGARDPPGTS